MVESLPGEIIGLFAGIAICAPTVYQLRAQISTPTKSPLPAHCWWLWAMGWFGLALLFMLVPRAPDSRSPDSPESPRTLGYFSLIACFLYQACWALDGVSPAASAFRKSKAVAQRLGPAILATCLVTLAVRYVHGPLIRSRPFYRDFLTMIASVFSAGHVLGSFLSPRSLSPAQITQGGPEVAGLYWMPIVMQMLGLFTGIFTCTLIYTNPEWYGITLLASFFASDAGFISAGRLKAHKEQRYSSVHS